MQLAHSETDIILLHLQLQNYPTMAATSAMQSILGSSVAYGAAGKNRSVNLQTTVPASYAVSSYLRVRSMAEVKTVS